MRSPAATLTSNRLPQDTGRAGEKSSPLPPAQETADVIDRFRKATRKLLRSEGPRD
jgi:hypothetical protein